MSALHQLIKRRDRENLQAKAGRQTNVRQQRAVMQNLALQERAILSTGSSTQGLGAVVSDASVLVVKGPRTWLIADLNAATAGSTKQTYRVQLESADSPGRIQDWSAITLSITPAETVADADVGVPTAPATVVLRGGVAEFELTPDTDAGVTKTYINGTKSTGDLTCVAGADLVKGDAFSLENALGDTANFEYTDDGTGTKGRILIAFSGSDTADDVAVATRAAINGIPLRITASGASATVALTQDIAGAAGDTTITESVADAGFLKTDFASGAATDAFGFTLAPVSGAVVDGSLSPLVVSILVV